MVVRARDTLGGPPAWSPDGQRVAVCVGKDIVVARPDGTEEGRLGQGSWNMQPSFHPQGDRVAFASYGDDWSLVESRVDGSDCRTLSRNLGWAPHYTPDGQKIVFTGLKENDYRTHVLDRNSGEETLLSRQGSFEIAKDLSPDGTKVAFESARGGYRVILSGLEGPGEVPLDPADAWYNNHNSPVFSPDGRSLVYERRPDVGDTDLWQARLTPFGAGPGQPLVGGPGNQIQPALSPDGRWLAYASDEQGDYDILAVRVGDNGPQGKPVVISAVAGDEYAPAWSPDGRRLAFRTYNDQDGDGFRVVEFGSPPSDQG